MIVEVRRERDNAVQREIWWFRLSVERDRAGLVLRGYVEEDRPTRKHGWTTVIREGRLREYFGPGFAGVLSSDGRKRACSAKPLGPTEVPISSDVAADACRHVSGQLKVVARPEDL